MILDKPLLRTYNYNNINYNTYSIKRKNGLQNNPIATCYKINTNLNLQPSVSHVSFKGFAPQKHLSQGIEKCVELIKSDEIKKIAFASHDIPDCDAVGSMVAGANEIEKATGKHADIFIMDELTQNTSFMDTEKIISLKKAFNGERPTPEQIREKFGEYDLVIATDTPITKLLVPEIKEGILKHAKHVIKIDHHLKSPKVSPEDYNFGEINVVDVTKDCTTQIIMQMVKPFGIDSEKISPKITDAIGGGIVTDSAQFQNVKSLELFEDAGLIEKTSNLGKISRIANSVDMNEFELIRKTMGDIKYNKNKDIAYFVLDRDPENHITQNVNIGVLTQIARNRDLKYYFSIMKYENPSDKIKVCLRSNEKPVNNIAFEYGGGGHSFMSAFTTRITNLENFVEELTAKLEKI